jgi:hypothetical protein
MRAGGGADQIVGIAHGCDPIAKRLVQRILETFAAGIDRGDLGAEQLHAENIERLTFDVDAAHKNVAFPLEQRRHRGGRNAMLTRAGLGSNARFVHALREQGLAQRIVHLVRAGMTKVLALKVNFRATELGGEISTMEKRGGAANIFA